VARMYIRDQFCIFEVAVAANNFETFTLVQFKRVGT
jgi:hypothetical protein